MAKKRTCLMCGQKYDYCPNCNNSELYPAWMVEFDTIECKELFNALSGYNMGIFDKEKLKAVIDKYNIKDFSKYDKNIAKQLNDIFGKKVEPVKTAEIKGNETKK